ncbi:MAG: hypothetical protein HY649_01770 [Acidobacteria bacterium]|nr:hypothetical protein [Acidobacteriota bacterium]
MGVTVCLMIALVGFSCSRQQEQASTEMQYPQPRYPRYLVKPNPDQLLAAARFAVRQPVGRAPLGKVQSGQTVHVLIQWGQDMNVWGAIQQAWAEKGVEAHTIGIWDVVGISKDEYDKKMAESVVHGNEGWKEAGIFWRADYRMYFPEEVQKEFGNPIVDFAIIDPYLNNYLDKHPEVKNLYGANGAGYTRWLTEPHKEKYQGNWIFYRPVDLLAKGAEFPTDVWNLVEEKILRPRPFVSEVTFQDPEGTNLHWTLTPEQAQLWAGTTTDSSNASNHIYIYPNPLFSGLQEGGVIAAHANHTGIYPTMKVTLDSHGSVKNIEGGAKTAEMFRFLMNHPAFQDVKFPKAPGPGYWFFRQDGFATNPKFVRSLPALVEGETFLPNASERNRAGIQHLAFGYNSEDLEDLAYAKQKGVPLGEGQHNFHMHVYFPTVKWKLRDTGEWVTVADKGHVTMYDDPEVRALASRYGDPDLIFRVEWVPSIPGVNVPGDYQKDFAADPWGWLMAEWKRIQEGTYAYFVDDYSLENRQVAQISDRP